MSWPFLVGLLFSRGSFCRDRFVAADAGFAHSIERLGVSHQRGRLAISQRTASGECQRDRGSRHIVGHLGDQYGIIRAEGEV